jgi:hypothetical protein
MSKDEAAPQIPTSAPPLSWPPPGRERLQGGLWQVIGLSWTGSLFLVLPLLWALAVEQPFHSLGPFEGNWQLGMGIAAIGVVLMVFRPDATYDEWRRRAERAIVHVPGEQELFDLAESGVFGSGGQELHGFLPRLMSLVLGSRGARSSCSSLIASLQ